MEEARHIVTGQVWRTDDPVPDAPEPLYKSFDEFITKVPEHDIRKWCQSKAHKANRPRLMSGAPTYKITGQQVMDILFAARGRCCYCGSLCVEKAPTQNGKLAPWAHVGRRIGSLEHKVQRVEFGDNNVDNFAWCCNWCNTWPSERRKGATDHGGIHE